MTEQPAEDLQCGAVVLAAGGSSRLGEPKQLVRWNGETLLARTVRLAREAGCAPIVVVLGYQAERVQAVLATADVQIVVNTEWASGMASSLRAGAAAWSAQSATGSSVLLMVCDQPRVEAEHLRTLLLRHSKESRKITAAAYAGRLGVPAIFARSMLDELMAATGDSGARAVIERHRSEAATLEMPEAEFDIDSPDDLSRCAGGF